MLSGDRALNGRDGQHKPLFKPEILLLHLNRGLIGQKKQIRISSGSDNEALPLLPPHRKIWKGLN